MIVKIAKVETRKEQEGGILLDGLKKLMFQITKQNMGNISKIVKTLETKKEESSLEVRTACITKPAKVPTGTKDLSLETYVKQIKTWNKINEDTNIKCKLRMV